MVHLDNGKKYSIDKRLAHKLDLIIRRIKGTDDALLLIDGDEGQGKSNMAAGIAGYIHIKTGRPLSVDNIFFDLDKLTDFAIKTEKQIIIWDEAALGGLAVEWWRKNQIKFTKLLMVARKKKHFIIICIPKFFKLNEYFVVDRSIGMINVYSKRNIQKGRFRYFNKKKKEKLYNSWKKSRFRAYTKFMSFGGSFVIALPKVFDEEEYEKKKDEAIMSIDKETPDKVKAENDLLKLILALITIKLGIVIFIAKVLGKDKRTIYKWKDKLVKYPEYEARIKECPLPVAQYK